MDTQQERKFRRFNFEHLVHVRFLSGNAKAEVDAVTRNISLGGLLLESDCLIPDRCPVEFIITLRGGLISRPVKLTGAGQVVRVQPGEAADKFAIAVACSQPITQLELPLTVRAAEFFRFHTPADG
jgi:hypothetical protein